mmetsp:Transcript_3349/g.3753  ORF Transcript_3349/g.3753 Transcript_3349/m.3753 type:complete len:209 (+) Transcript_3349:24-650(+)|eukprot:CAMPEP_0194135092 /NCGR_PEP_ID=MMETSP0152-20130528/5181_1 /TAXON_ID=1049557 /ORGANISM="Thalassiothrix antarctica, Strain L6-D1" /LENGTH=208 /DNA_ID=CAMNT_0038831151 /DNA_START=18 /DNA_END=644 /DNA_ORIENTATION=-
MKSDLISSILIVSTAAFSPAKTITSKVSSNLNSQFANELGAQPPAGFWDPLNLVRFDDQERFDRLRYVEVKHGRISMLAVLGHIITTAGYRLPGDIDKSGTAFTSIKTGLKGIDDIPQSGLIQIIAFIGFLEVFVMKDVTGKAEFPGDFRNGFIDFGWDSFTEEEKFSKRAIELNNGRAAMMGILGLMVHEQISGQPYIINSLFGYRT